MTPLNIIAYAATISVSVLIIGIPVVVLYLAVKQDKKKG